MKIKTLIIALLLIVSLAYVGAKGYIYYKTKDALDEISRVIAPILQVEYIDVGSSLLSNTIHINNIRITPTGTYDEVSIQTLSISGHNFNFLIALTSGFKNGQFPSQMTVAFEKLQAPTSSSFVSNLSSSFYKNKEEIEMETCSIPGIFNCSGLQDLNIASISINGRVGYIYDKTASQAVITLKYDLAGIESTLIDMKLNQLPSQALAGIGKLPVFEEINIERRYEPSYMKKIVNHCATDVSLAASEFIDNLFTQSDSYYLKSLGFIPGPGLSKLFRQLITNGGTVEVKAKPSSEISPALLRAYRPEDLADLFGVTASYNSTPITDLSFSMQSNTPKKETKTSARKNNVKQQVVAMPARKIKKPRPKPKKRLRYLDTDPSSLENYINYKVRVFTLNNSKPKQGILTSITKKKLDIEHLVFGGKMTSHIEIENLDRVEVLRRE